ncbi:MAG TPA: hypothetical protein PKA64_05595 [Myxococcota bacterium]|nr:hypothetical protein [Myxococcota bacterium]
MLNSLGLDDLTIRDARAFRHVPLYGRLERLLRDADARFLVPPEGEGSWDRALFLNLTYWAGGADVLVDASIDADVIAHVAWHHAARRALGRPEGSMSVDAMFLGEAIASAFDLYLVGSTLGRKGRCGFLETQVPAMTEVAEAAGMDPDAFAEELGRVAENPGRAFEDLRALLMDATTALYACRDARAADAALDGLGGRRFGPLLHHYELSTWVLYARAYGDAGEDPAAREVDAGLRAAEDPVGWLSERWLRG